MLAPVSSRERGVQERAPEAAGELPRQRSLGTGTALLQSGKHGCHMLAASKTAPPHASEGEPFAGLEGTTKVGRQVGPSALTAKRAKEARMSAVANADTTASQTCSQGPPVSSTPLQRASGGGPPQ